VLADREAGFVRGPSPLDDICSGELRALLAMLEQAELAERANGAAAPAAAEPDDRPPPPKDDFAFMPREPVLGLLQSALEVGVDEHGAPVEVVRMLDDRRSGPTPIVTDRALKDAKLRVTPEGRRIFGRKEVTHPKFLSDPRWARSLLAMLHRRLHGRVPFNPVPATPPPLAGDARLVIVGDWGSGLPRAADVAKHMRRALDDPAAARRQKVVIHLGDVYYSGEESEYRRNFLDPWPVRPGEADEIQSYSLNGNHDMYIGGGPYFGVGLADARFKHQAGSSWFSLANDHWQFLALDTSYEDGGLHGDQAAWVRQMRAEHPERKTALLSHHQLFSAYEPGATGLRTKIRWVLQEAPIDAWFWGHEHRCLVYEDLENVRFATCIGHGGIPEYLVKPGLVSPRGLVYEYRRIHSTDWQPWNTFGFAIVDLDGDRMTVRYVDERGVEHYQHPPEAAP
jgi:hypothetical protein